MRMGLSGILALVAAVGTAGAASAADLSPPLRPLVAAPIYTPVSAYNWTGWYLGVQGGYDWNHASTFSGGFTYPANENGLSAGVYGGYNWQPAGNWVFGVDTSINYDWARGSATSGGLLPSANSAGPTWKGLFRGRVGYAWDRFLVYGTAGGAIAGYSASTVGPPGSGSATPFGWTVGGGIEVAMTQRWTARLDYSYQNYGTFNAKGSGTFAGGVPVSLTGSTLMAGIAYKF